jgi:hypothetical protein
MIANISLMHAMNEVPQAMIFILILMFSLILGWILILSDTDMLVPILVLDTDTDTDTGWTGDGCRILDNWRYW